MFSGSKYAGFGANEAPAECSMPWSTGRIETYPVPASRPAPNIACRLVSTRAGRSDRAQQRSTKSGPGRCRSDAGMVRQR